MIALTELLHENDAPLYQLLNMVSNWIKIFPKLSIEPIA